MSKHGPRNWSTIRRPSPECQIYSRWTRPAAAPTRVNSTGEDPGTIPSFGCIAGVTAFLTLVHGPARIPVPQVLQMNCVPRSVWSTTPVGKLPRVVAAMSSAVMTRARVVLLAHGVSEHSTRVRIAHGAQVDPALGAAQVGKVRDPHAVQGALVPLAGAVILMGHRARAGRAWTGVGACSGLSGLGGASTRRPPAHLHPRPRASEHGGCEEPHRCRPTPRVPRPPPHPNAAAPMRACPAGWLGFSARNSLRA